MPDSGRWPPSGGDPSLNEITRADRFIDALSTKQPVYSTDAAEAQLSFLLSGWRDDVRDVPITAPVTAGDAVAALQDGLRSGRGSRRSLAVVGSVAAAMLCLGGFGTAVYGAGPGDALYGVRSAMFGQQEATRDDQVALASAQLQEVQQLIDEGQWEQAQDKLVAVSNTVNDVDPTQSKVQLVEQWNALTYKVVEQDPAAVLPPGEPLPVLPSSPLTWLPVPVVEAPVEGTSDASTTSTPSDGPPTSDTTSGVPPEVLMTSPPDTSATSATTETSPTSPSSSTPPSSTTTAPQTSSTTTTPATTAPATTTPATTPPATTPPPSSATVTTTTTVRPATTSSRAVESSAPPVVQQPSPPAELPPAQPRLVPDVPSAARPVEAPAPSPAAPSQAPAAVAPAPSNSAATTTTVPRQPAG